MEIFHLLLIYFLCLLIPFVHSRGPHHPRGAKIVKRHVHTKPSKNIKLTEDAELLHDREHIQVNVAQISVPNFKLATLEILEQLTFEYFSVFRNTLKK